MKCQDCMRLSDHLLASQGIIDCDRVLIGTMPSVGTVALPTGSLGPGAFFKE